jgi:hypothetical protein
MQTPQKRFLLVLLAGLLVLTWLGIQAQAARADGPAPARVRQQATLVPDDPEPIPMPSPTPSPTPRPNPITQIFQHVINFDATGSLLTAWTRVMESAQEKALEDLEPALEDAARRAARGFLRFSALGLEGLDDASGESAFLGAVKDLWSRVFSVAVLLFPLSVLMNLAAVLVSGVSAPVARAEMLEALARALLTLGVAAGSFLLTGVMIKIAWGAAAVVASEPAGGDGSYLETLFMRLLVSTIGVRPFESLMAIFITLTILFLALMAVSALILSYFAVLTLTVTLVALAPLIIVVGSLPEFRWVYAAWMRAFVSVLLIPLANAILFKMWAVFALQGESIVDVLVGLGFICIIITVNFYTSKLVFGPALESGKLAAGSMTALFHLAVAAVGLMGGLAAFGGAAAAAGGASAAGSAGSAPAGGGPGGSGAGGALPGIGGASGSSAGNGAARTTGAAALPYPGSSGDGFQERVERWKGRTAEERQAAQAGLEQERERTRAAGRFSEALAGRDPLLRAAAGFWSAGRQAGLSAESAAIRAADEQVQTEARARRSKSGLAFGSPEPGAAAAAHSMQPGSFVAGAPAQRPSAPGLNIAASWAPTPGSTGQPSASGEVSSGVSSTLPGAGNQFQTPVGQPPLPPDTAGIYPVLFGNPAYDEQTLTGRGWSPTYQDNLHQNLRGYYAASQSAARQAGLPDAGALYDPLEMRPVLVERGSNLGAAPSQRVSPAMFQAAAVRVGAPWLPQAGSDLPGAQIMARPDAEQVLRRVAEEMPGEPVGRLAREILETGQTDPGNLSPSEFWERVVVRVRRDEA